MKGTKSRWKMWKPRGKGQLACLGSLILLCLFFLYYVLLSNKNIKISGEVREFSLEREMDPFNTWLNSYNTLNEPKEEGPEVKPRVFQGEKLVHLDLKGAPPKVRYLSKLFPLLASLGATGIVMEYEDMFPYSREEIPALNKYSSANIARIVQVAEENKLKIIPLVQVFGHLEFVLKNQAFMSYREVEGDPQAICPSLNETRTLLSSMIDDIVRLHPHSTHIHIGCDEVYTIGKCPRCKKRLENNIWTTNQLFLDHVTSIARYINHKYPHLTVLTWDDEFRHLSVEEMKAFRVGELLEPVIWNYKEDVGKDLLPGLWQKYARVFQRVWIASAFKGAQKPNSVEVVTSHYLSNHKSWMEIVETYSKDLEFAGIIMTGWQRYDHFAVLCELLPVAIPSLALNLIFLSTGERKLKTLAESVQLSIKCNSQPLMRESFSPDIKCAFPGAEIFQAVNLQPEILQELAGLKSESYLEGWLSPYNIDNDFSSPRQLNIILKKVKMLLYKFDDLESIVSRAMEDVFDNFTIAEWIATHLTPYKNELISLDLGTRKLLEREVWPRRPLPSVREDKP